jgi:hypothetical protein
VAGLLRVGPERRLFHPGEVPTLWWRKARRKRGEQRRRADEVLEALPWKALLGPREVGPPQFERQRQQQPAAAEPVRERQPGDAGREEARRPW